MMLLLMIVMMVFFKSKRDVVVVDAFAVEGVCVFLFVSANKNKEFYFWKLTYLRFVVLK